MAEGWNLAGVDTHMDVRVKQRRGLAFALRADGLNERQIAEVFGVCRERVRQILAEVDRRIFKRADFMFPPFVRRWEPRR